MMRRVHNNVIRAIEEIDHRLGDILNEHANYIDDGTEKVLTGKAGSEVRELDAERARLVNWLKDNGGLPPGMTEVW